MSPTVNIVDVRTDENHNNDSNTDLGRDILAGLDKAFNQKTLPTLLLYNERGLRLYDDITTEAPEYYLFGAEEEILKHHANEIAQVMHSREDGQILPGEVIVELGAG